MFMSPCEWFKAKQLREIKFREEIGIMPIKKVELFRLGRRLRRARKLLGLSQGAFAMRCGLDRAYLGGIERGTRNLTFGVLCTICEGLTVDIAALTVGIPATY
jgi:DNA-binding XRE family transcriptional regulator